MEEKTEAKIPDRINLCPNLALTTTIRPPPATRRLVKTLSALLGIPIISRGKSNLDEIAYIAYRAKIKSFAIFFSKHKQPSRIDVYRFINGYYQRIGYILLDSYQILGKPNICIGCEIKFDNSDFAQKLKKLIGFFISDTCENYQGKLSQCIIKQDNFNRVVEFWIKKKQILLLKIRDVRLTVQ